MSILKLHWDNNNSMIFLHIVYFYLSDGVLTVLLWPIQPLQNTNITENSSCVINKEDFQQLIDKFQLRLTCVSVPRWRPLTLSQLKKARTFWSINAHAVETYRMKSLVTHHQCLDIMHWYVLSECRSTPLPETLSDEDILQMEKFMRLAINEAKKGRELGKVLSVKKKLSKTKIYEYIDIWHTKCLILLTSCLLELWLLMEMVKLLHNLTIFGLSMTTIGINSEIQENKSKCPFFVTQ